jgi:hypothetical protein
VVLYWPEKWNDIPMDKIQPGYVVEYEIPEPATLILFSLGGFVLRRKK